MDEDLRRAQRVLERAHGFDETLLTQNYINQVYSYVANQGLTIEFGGVSENTAKIIMEKCPNRIMVSHTISFIENITLPQEDPLPKIIGATRWDDWFHLISYYQHCISKQVGSSIWNKIRANDTRVASDGSTYLSRMTKSMSEWQQFKMVCTLRPPWQPRPEHGCYMWSAAIQLVGFNPLNDTLRKDEDALDAHRS